jgi:hypothetical protein
VSAASTAPGASVQLAIVAAVEPSYTLFCPARMTLVAAMVRGVMFAVVVAVEPPLNV